MKFILDFIIEMERDEHPEESHYSVVLGKSLADIVEIIKNEYEKQNKLLYFIEDLSKLKKDKSFYPVIKYDCNNREVILYIDETIDDNTMLICGPKNLKYSTGIGYYVLYLASFDTDTNSWFTQYGIADQNDHPETHYITIKIKK